MVVLDTAMFFIDVNNAVKEVSYTLTSDSDLDLSDRYARTAFLPYAAQTALYAFLVRSFYSFATDSGLTTAAD